MALVNVGGSVFVDETKIDLKEAAPKEWSPALSRLSVYPYVKFPSLERVEWGLALTEGEPRGKWLDWQKVGDDRFSEPIAPLIEVEEARRLIERGSRGLLEETPFAEISDLESYLGLLRAGMGPGTTPESVKEASDWSGPGVYDLRDFSRHKESVEEYEKESMEFWADNALEGMFQGDQWKKDLRTLLLKNR